MKTTRIILSLVVLLFGIFMFVFGGYDDSPGAQGLGLLLCILGGMSIARNIKNI